MFQSIRTKLLTIFTIFGLLPLIVFGLFAYNMYLGALRNRITEYSTEVVVSLQSDVDNYLLDISTLLNQEEDYYINQFIQLTRANDFAGNRKYTFRLWENFNNQRSLKRGLVDTGLIFPDGRQMSTYGLFYGEKKTYYQLDNLKKTSEDFYISKPHRNFLNQTVISLVKYFKPEQDEESIIYYADISLDSLARMTNVKLGEKGYVLITDQTGQIIYHPERENIGEITSFFSSIKGDQEDPDYFTTQGKEYIVTGQNSKITDWKIISVAYSREIGAELYQLRQFSILIIAMMIILLLLLSIYFSYEVSYPIQKLQGLTHQAAANDLSVEIDIKGDDEIAQLGQSFNKMIKRIRELLEENIEEQIMIRELEMESLQNQIKPHFIYNTLDMIIGQLESDRNEEATYLIEALGKFFRLSLSHGKEMVMVANEIQHVENYLYIQQLRHGTRYEYMVNVEEDVKDYFMPKLLLQPLVENSIYHGILPGDKKGLIVIKGYCEGSDIIFEVVDNGVGISPDILSEIDETLSNVNQKQKHKDKYFGLRNINLRIKLKFGEDYGLSITSKPGVKTVSKIRLKKTGGEEIVQAIDS